MRRGAGLAAGVGVALVIGLLPQGGAQAQFVSPPDGLQYRDVRVGAAGNPGANGGGAGNGGEGGNGGNSVEPGLYGVAKKPKKKSAPLSPEVVQGMFAQTPAEWAPQGQIIADSGFRPWPNGFNFFNFGGGTEINAQLGHTTRPAGIDTKGMAQMIGPQACRQDLDANGKPTKPTTKNCTLTAQAAYMQRSINDMTRGGHCFGMATLAQRIYMGLESPAKFKGGAHTVGIDFAAPVQEEISRWWATQIFAEGPSAQTPNQLLQTLIADFRTGKTSNVLALFFPYKGKTAGHAITPYAVYDRGGGLYDIAVYDNNYPSRARAVHVNTNTNTMEYFVGSRPKTGPILAKGSASDIQFFLQPISAVAGKLPCTFCTDAQALTLQFAAVESSADVKITVTKPDGGALAAGDLVQERAIATVSHEGWFTPPSVTVKKGVPFKVTVENTSASGAINSSFSAHSAVVSWGVDAATLRPGQRDSATYYPGRGFVDYEFGGASRPLLTAIVNESLQPNIEYTVKSLVVIDERAGSRKGAVTKVRMNLSPQKDQVSLTTLGVPAKFATTVERWGTKRDIVWRVPNVELQKGRALVIDYGDGLLKEAAPVVSLRGVGSDGGRAGSGAGAGSSGGAQPVAVREVSSKKVKPGTDPGETEVLPAVQLDGEICSIWSGSTVCEPS